ncbi:MAG: hypothetical protein AAB581_00035 [Patescibacteria group bacterium]
MGKRKRYTVRNRSTRYQLKDDRWRRWQVKVTATGEKIGHPVEAVSAAQAVFKRAKEIKKISPSSVTAEPLGSVFKPEKEPYIQTQFPFPQQLKKIRDQSHD